ncbi:MAG TPA: hypothetical protein VGL04_09015 [Sporichthyaceae bacterium]
MTDERALDGHSVGGAGGGTDDGAVMDAYGQAAKLANEVDSLDKTDDWRAEPDVRSDVLIRGP